MAARLLLRTVRCLPAAARTGEGRLTATAALPFALPAGLVGCGRFIVGGPVAEGRVTAPPQGLAPSATPSANIPAGDRRGTHDGHDSGGGSASGFLRGLCASTGSSCILLLLAGGAAESECSDQSDEEQRLQRMSESKVQKTMPPTLRNIEAFGAMLVPYVNKTFAAIDVIAPSVVHAFQAGRAIYTALPITVIEALAGLALCFFGGVYPLTVAAAEAFRASGGTVAVKSLAALWAEIIAVYEANKADNARDEDGDGVADVQQISRKELLGRKVALVSNPVQSRLPTATAVRRCCVIVLSSVCARARGRARACASLPASIYTLARSLARTHAHMKVMKTADPEKLLEAYKGLAQAMAGVCAALKLRFAKVLALAHSIAAAIRPVMVQVLGPVLIALVPSDYHKWISPTIEVSCKVLAGSVAWFLYRLVAALHSGVSVRALVHARMMGGGRAVQGMQQSERLTGR